MGVEDKGKTGARMNADRRAIADLLDMHETQVKIDRYLYASNYPDEIKAWKLIDRDDPDLRRFQGKSYYPASALMAFLVWWRMIRGSESPSWRKMSCSYR
jgi:hypothetical protein